MKVLEPRLDRLVALALSYRTRGPLGDLRRFLGGVLWILRTGAPWRDLPDRFGGWNSTFRRFRRWVQSGRWAELRARLHRDDAVDDDHGILLIDSTVIHAHPDAGGARGSTAAAEALGRSRGGFTTKVHALVSTRGRGLAIALTPGQRGDITQAVPLLASVPCPRAVVGDRAYDADALLGWLEDRSVNAVIPARRNRRLARPLDRALYALRNVIERFFGRLKRFRRVGTRFDKTAGSFEAFVWLGVLGVGETAWP